MQDESRQQLITIYLKHSSAAGPLRTLAFAQLAAKALYLLDEPASSHEVERGIADLLGIQGTEAASVEAGIRYLDDLGNVRPTATRGKWELTPDAKRTIESELEETNQHLDAVLQRHFPRDLEPAVLKRWFSTASAAVFGHYSDELVASVCRMMRKPRYEFATLNQRLESSISDHGLQSSSEALVRGFQAFLESANQADQQHLMSLIQAMFSARLVAAEIGADPITLEEFRGAQLLLDTNFLFAVSLEDHRLAKSLKALSRALQAIGVQLRYLHPTADEYARTLEFKRTQIMGLVGGFAAELLEATRDDFVATARSRNCRSQEDYARFFDSLRNVPVEMASELPIAKLDDDVTSLATRAAAQDEHLKNRIREFGTRLRPRRYPKGVASLEHDAALLHVAASERKQGSKTWVLSLDRTLQACSVDQSGQHEMPLVICVDALGGILAANAAGPGADAGDFAPLLGRMILAQCEPALGTFSAIDLESLNRITERAGELSIPRAKEVLRSVARFRAAGKGPESTEVQLLVNRALEQERVDADEKVREAQAQRRDAEERERREREEKESRERDLVCVRAGQIVATARKWFRIQLAWRLPVSFGIGWVVLVSLRDMLHVVSDWEGVVSYGGGVIAFMGIGWGLIRRAWMNYLRRVSESGPQARREVESGKWPAKTRQS